MEALIAFGVNWKLLLIQVVNFGLLLILLYRYLYKPLFALIEKRQHVIEKGLSDAASAKLEKEKIEGERDGILQAAREEGGEIVDTLRKQALEQERQMLRNAEEKSHAHIAEAMVKAKDEREYILRETEKDITRMAILAAEKILQGKAPHA